MLKNILNIGGVFFLKACAEKPPPEDKVHYQGGEGRGGGNAQKSVPRPKTRCITFSAVVHRLIILFTNVWVYGYEGYSGNIRHITRSLLVTQCCIKFLLA